MIKLLKKWFGLESKDSVSMPASKKAGTRPPRPIPKPQFNKGLSGPLISAVQNVNVKDVKQLLTNGADPNTCAGDQKVPVITVGVLEGDSENMAEIVRTLIEHGADPDATWTDLYQKQTTALMIAAESNYPTITQTLLHCGANPNLRDGQGRTALERCSGGTIHSILSRATVAGKLSLPEAIAHAKTFVDVERDRISQQYEPTITIEKSCANCAFLNRIDYSCKDFAAMEDIGAQIDLSNADIAQMYCDNWEDEMLVSLLQRGITAPGINYHRRHPTLLDSDAKQTAWIKFIGQDTI